MHSVYVDGHFGTPHFHKAGSATTSDPYIQHHLLPDGLVVNFLNDPTSSAAPADALEDCSNFSADRMLARTSAKYDRTGIAGAFCRHGMILALINMMTGMSDVALVYWY